MTQSITAIDGTPASRFAFGTMQFGGGADADESRALHDDARRAGITFFDTAHVYTEGRSETLLGDFIRTERDSLIIASKVGYTGGASAANMQAQFDLSRQRLQLECVDVLYIHRFDPDTDLRDTMTGFHELKASGAIRYIGLSNFAAWQVMKAAAFAAQMDLSVDILQPMYNLVKRQAEVELRPRCDGEGIGVTPYSPLGGGLLTGKYAEGGTGRLSQDARYGKRYGLDFMPATAAGLSACAARLGVPPATPPVAWVAAHPSPPTPIISARSPPPPHPSLPAIPNDLPPPPPAPLAARPPPPPPPPSPHHRQLA